VGAIADELELPYRLIGGNAVSLLVAVHGVADRTPQRETADADFAAAYEVVADPRLVPALRGRGHRQVEGNRFARAHELPASETSTAGSWELFVDVLAPSYLGRLVTNQPHGDLVVDEIPGLSLALNRPPTQVTVQVRLTTGHELNTHLLLPDVVAALCLKAYAYRGRMTDRDALDIWRLLEAAQAAGVTVDTWPDSPSAVAATSILHQYFGRPGAAGLRQAASRPADQTRVRALVGHVVGPHDPARWVSRGDGGAPGSLRRRWV